MAGVLGLEGDFLGDVNIPFLGDLRGLVLLLRWKDLRGLELRRFLGLPKIEMKVICISH